MVAGLVLGAHAGTTPDWVRQTADELDAGTPFIIVSTASSFDQLSAGGIYRWVGKKAPVILKGRRGSYGDFWPTVSYEVGAEEGKKWKVIGESTPELPVTIKFDAENPKGTIDMEPFRSSIGKLRRGRIVLPNGEAAEIMLDDLLPVPASRGASGLQERRKRSRSDAVRQPLCTTLDNSIFRSLIW